MPADLILGTAGHIDHGKTSLIRALTGVDTDRLPEEKRRGITIDLGFAELAVGEFRLGLVDVPGHERFIRNMLAGATGMDLAMLVVAADDSVKQQTREHLDILRMLDLRAGVIVVTKCDLVEEGWLSLVEDDIRQLVAGSFLERSPFVHTSVATGRGLDELRTRLHEAATIAAAADASAAQGPFRMAIDRAFTVAGHGTIVTGSVSSGRANVGDELVIEPGGTNVRIRGLQNHDQSVEEVHRGQRAAINLAGVHHDAVQRGHELATPGHLVPSTLMTAQLHLLPHAPPLRNRSRIRWHGGTAEILANVALLDSDELAPGQSGLVQFFLSEPAVATWNQPFVIRQESPLRTIGGGRVLDPNAERIRRLDATTTAHLRALAAGDPSSRASASLFLAGIRGWEPRSLSRLAGISDGELAREELARRNELCEIPVSPTRVVRVHRQTLEAIGERVVHSLSRLHEASPLRLSFPRSGLAHEFAYLGEAVVFNAVLEQLAKAGRIELTADSIALVGQGPKLSRGEQALLAQLIDWFRSAGLQSPSPDECRERASKNRASVTQLLTLAVASGDLIEVSPEYYLHSDVEREARQTLAATLKAEGGKSLSAIRELLGTTRKYAVPLCEYWDRIGFTQRVGDERVLGKTNP